MSFVDFTQSVTTDSGVCLLPNFADFNTEINSTTHSTNEHLTHDAFTRYIISFNEYKMINVHTQFIMNTLHDIPSHLYQIIDRQNPSTIEYPTDFIIINILKQPHNDILSVLNQQNGIKYVHKDRIIQNRQILNSEDYDKNENEQRRDLGDYPYRTGGKLHTPFPEFEEEEEFEQNSDRKLKSFFGYGGNFLITDHLGASKLWKDGFDGLGVNVAVFDTGIDGKHTHFNHIEERTNWTDEDQLQDGIGHGSFVAGIIASKYKKCPGFAPNANIHTFRVFTNKQMSYTSWFLDSFNYAIYRKMNLLNLSIGGPDWRDMPFVDKVREMQANNVIMITACGNDGKYGTINNPADQPSVIGVGGLTQNQQHIASFQSRGMTTWELPHGYGRVKPDVVTVGQSLYGSAIESTGSSQCRTLSGTSVASPVITGVAALLSSVVPAEHRWDIINPASMKQVLVESADVIDSLRMFEQGNGAVNLQHAYKYISNYKKHVSAIPSKLDFTKCPHAWPFCEQPLYHTSQPYIFNVTLLNPFSVIGQINHEPSFEITSSDGDHSDLINIEFTYSQRLWPWCGWLGVFIYASEHVTQKQVVSGTINVEIDVLSGKGPNDWDTHIISIPYSLKLIETPPKSNRILWDQFHSLPYPLGYFPRDDLEKESDMLDWFGDHLQSNYHKLYDYLKDHGYFVEVLRTDFSCIDPSLYSTLIIADSEDKFDKNELKKLHFDVYNEDLSVLIFADWYNDWLMEGVRFFDDNTRSLWDALTGGANVPALNDLLAPFDIVFGDVVAVGNIQIGSESTYFQSGNVFKKAPINAWILQQDMNKITNARGASSHHKAISNAVPLVLYDTKSDGQHANGGRIAAFGDSTCLDANQHRSDCYWLIDLLLKFTSHNQMDRKLQSAMVQVTEANVYGIFNHFSQSKPVVRKEYENLFNAVSRAHNMGHTHCGLDGKVIEDKGGIIHKPKGKVYEGEEGKYHHEVMPGFNNFDGIKRGTSTYDGMVFYPILIMIVWAILMCVFCRPVRRIIKCDEFGHWIERKWRGRGGYQPVYPRKRRNSTELLNTDDSITPTVGSGQEARSRKYYSQV